jgi:hypothetical protein
MKQVRTKTVLYAKNQAVVTQSKIRGLRRVIKQLPVEIFQQCSIASSCS